MKEEPIVREIALSSSHALEFAIRPFGSKLPRSAGVFVLLQRLPPVADSSTLAAAIVLAGAANDLDAAVGSQHGNHPKFWTLIALDVCEVGFRVMPNEETRTRILEAIIDFHAPRLNRFWQ